MDLLTILYRDEQLVAIDKPHNLLVHKSRLSRDHLAVVQLLRDQVNRLVYPVHRLDRATSGVLLFALTPEAARFCGAAFETREVRKRYLAVVRGNPGTDGVIDHPLRPPDGDLEQDALTRWSRLAGTELPDAAGPHATGRYALLEIEPRTGRQHQIRRHFKHLSHPLIGDTTYGDGRQNRFFRERFQCYRLLLHSADLWIPHPTRHTPLHLHAPLPPSMRTVLDQVFPDCNPGGTLYD